MLAVFLFGMIIGVLLIAAIISIRFLLLLMRVKCLNDQDFKRFIEEVFERSIV